MSIVFREIHTASETALNEEWFILENTGTEPFNAAGVAAIVVRPGPGPKRKPQPIGALQPGFVLKPGQRIRLVTGTPGKKSQGDPPAETEEVANYHLFLGQKVFAAAGTEVRLSLRQKDVARVRFDPAAPSGIAAT